MTTLEILKEVELATTIIDSTDEEIDNNENIYRGTIFND